MRRSPRWNPGDPITTLVETPHRTKWQGEGTYFAGPSSTDTVRVQVAAIDAQPCESSTTRGDRARRDCISTTLTGSARSSPAVHREVPVMKPGSPRGHSDPPRLRGRPPSRHPTTQDAGADPALSGASRTPRHLPRSARAAQESRLSRPVRRPGPAGPPWPRHRPPPDRRWCAACAPAQRRGRARDPRQ